MSKAARRKPRRGLCRGPFSPPEAAALCTRQSWAPLRGWSFQSGSEKWIEKRTFPTKIKGGKKRKVRVFLTMFIPRSQEEDPLQDHHPHRPRDTRLQKLNTASGIHPRSVKVCLAGRCAGHIGSSGSLSNPTSLPPTTEKKQKIKICTQTSQKRKTSKTARGFNCIWAPGCFPTSPNKTHPLGTTHHELDSDCEQEGSDLLWGGT